MLSHPDFIQSMENLSYHDKKKKSIAVYLKDHKLLTVLKVTNGFKTIEQVVHFLLLEYEKKYEDSLKIPIQK